MTDELKPVRCGCGGEARVMQPSYTHCRVVMCPNCGIKTAYMNTEAEAVDAWNKAMSGHTRWSRLADVRPEGVYCKGCGYRMDEDE